MKIDSAYLAVIDRKRAESFWTEALQQQPSLSNDSFTFFDIDGFLFGLFDPASVSEQIHMGNNCILNIRVKNADKEFQRLKKISRIAMPLNSVGIYRVFQIEDSEGNIVEFYSSGENT